MDLIHRRVFYLLEVDAKNVEKKKRTKKKREEKKIRGREEK
jgi:hypothetical protein